MQINYKLFGENLNAMIDHSTQEQMINGEQSHKALDLVKMAQNKLNQLPLQDAIRFLEKKLPKKFEKIMGGQVPDLFKAIDAERYKIFSDLHQLASDPNNLGTMSSIDADDILTAAPPNSWLLRFSERSNRFTFSNWDENRKISHTPIDSGNIDVFLQKFRNNTEKTPISPTIAPDLKTFGKHIKSDNYNFGDLTREQAELILQRAPPETVLLRYSTSNTSFVFSGTNLTAEGKMTFIHNNVPDLKSYEESKSILKSKGYNILRPDEKIIKKIKEPKSEISPSEIGEKERIGKEKELHKRAKRIKTERKEPAKPKKKVVKPRRDERVKTKRTRIDIPSRGEKELPSEKTEKTFGPWKPVLPGDPKKEEAKMQKNAIKAIREHQAEATRVHGLSIRKHEADIHFHKQQPHFQREIVPIRDDDTPYFADLESVPLVHESPRTQLLTIEQSFSLSDIGYGRGRNEDAHLHVSQPNYELLAVFDGHGGKDVSKFAKKFTEKNFDRLLQKYNNNAYEALEALIDSIEGKVKDLSNWDHEGSTAVISFVDKVNHRVITATVGDSEANIYREIEGKLKSIPLSDVRDWASPKDKQRWEKTMGRELNISPETNPKTLRFPEGFVGVNVSRSLGDEGIKNLKTKNVNVAMTHKPKISSLPLFPGDIIKLCCDGDKDNLTEKETIETLKQFDSLPEAVKSLKDTAIEKMKSGKGANDNITMIGFKLK